MTGKLNVHQRLAAAMGDVDYIQKERKSGMNYTIVSHDAVTAKVRPVLLKHGIVYYPVRCDHVHNGNRAECSLTVRFVNVDEPSDHFDVPTFGYGIDPQDKGPGKAMSYAVKYALLKALGLETGDDPDHESVNFIAEDPHKPAFNAKSASDRIKSSISRKADVASLTELYHHEGDCIAKIQATDKTLHAEVIAEFAKRKKTLLKKEGANANPPSIGNSGIHNAEGRELHTTEGM